MIQQASAFDTTINKEGIVITRVRKNANIGIKEANENSIAVLRLNKGKKCPLLVDTRKIRSITKEARDHFAMKNRSGNVNSIAILVDSPLSRVIGNFFMGLNRPKVATKLFTDEEEAMAWLRKFINAVDHELN